MATAILSQIFGLIRQRLLVGTFGASDTLGVYLTASKFPDFLFQLIIAGALATAFIPIFSEYLGKGKKDESNRMASTLLSIGLVFFGIISLILFIFAPFILQFFNLGSGYSPSQMDLMASLMRVIIIGEMIFLVASFFSAILQSNNNFFIAGVSAALYNFGIIIGILLLSDKIGIYAPAIGIIIGALIFTLVQAPFVFKTGFRYIPSFSLKIPGVMSVINLMGPRTLNILIFQLGTLIVVAIISFLPSSGRSYVIYDYALTLAFAPIVLFGQTIGQAALPILSKERERLETFKELFVGSFNQILYLILPVSVLFLVLRIPVVRLIYGASQFDWEATVLTGRTLAFFSLSIFAVALIYLVSRAFYALQDTKTPLIVTTLTTVISILLSILFVSYWSSNLERISEVYSSTFRLIPVGVESIAFAYSIGMIINLIILLILLNKKINFFGIKSFLIPQIKIFICALFMGIALYIPIKLLDQLVFDTTRTVNLILLTGISSLIGILIYFFLTWLLNVKEAGTFLLLFKRVGGWKEVVGKSEKIIQPNIGQ